MSSDSIDIASVTADYLAFREGFRTLVLSTVAADGAPHVSYAPFVEHDGALFIYVSELAGHTRHLLRTRRCAALLIEDEQACRNLFARRRVVYQCSTDEIDQASEFGQQMLDRMQARLGGTFELLRTLKDFHLIQLDVIGGSYVAGFGRAFAIHSDGSLEHVSRM
jgi:putative heme iron utilization protein